MHRRSKHIPITEAKPGMRLAESISLSSSGYLSLKLAQGQELTMHSISQLVAHGAEQILVTELDERSDMQIALDSIDAAQHVKEIFADADLNDPTTAALYQQILIYRRES